MQSIDTFRTRQDGYWTVVCAECNQSFDAKRSDASFCSSKCRVAWSRRPQKLLNAIERLREMELEVSEMAIRYRKSDKVYQAVKRLQKSVTYSMNSFETE